MWKILRTILRNIIPHEKYSYRTDKMLMHREAASKKKKTGIPEATRGIPAEEVLDMEMRRMEQLNAAYEKDRTVLAKQYSAFSRSRARYIGHAERLMTEQEKLLSYLWTMVSIAKDALKDDFVGNILTYISSISSNRREPTLTEYQRAENVVERHLNRDRVAHQQFQREDGGRSGRGEGRLRTWREQICPKPPRARAHRARHHLFPRRRVQTGDGGGAQDDSLRADARGTAQGAAARRQPHEGRAGGRGGRGGENRGGRPTDDAGNHRPREEVPPDGAAAPCAHGAAEA